MKKRKQKHCSGGSLLLILLILVLAMLLVWVMVSTMLADAGEPGPQASAFDTGKETASTEPTALSIPQTTQTPVLDPYPLDLGQGIVLLDVGNYSGMFMEDGSNEIVSDVCMILVENQGGSDLQYAEISLTFADGDYRFQITNLPVGEKAVILEQERTQTPNGELMDAEVSNVAWFTDKMDPHTEQFEISGGKGALNIKNVSGESITGDIYVYYKYAAEDIYYGGITFRVKIEGGLEAGELRQVISGHYDPELCRIVDISWHES